MASKKKNKQDLVVPNDSQEDQLLWKQFVLTCSVHIDPVLASILHSTDLLKFDRNKQVIEVVTYKKFMFFQDLFIEQKAMYQKYLNQLFGYQVMLMIQFTKVDQPHMLVKTQPVTTGLDQGGNIKHSYPVQDTSGSSKNSLQTTIAKQAVKEYSKKTYKLVAPQELALNERSLDISDKQKWKITNQLLQHFGGSVKEIIKDLHEFDA